MPRDPRDYAFLATASQSAQYLLCLVLLTTNGVARRAENVLLLISDNQTATDMGCYGHPDIRTPNLDRLAAGGTRFQRFRHGFVLRPQPRRDLHRTADARQRPVHARPFVPQWRARPRGKAVFDLVKACGYRTALFGKTSFTPLPGQYELDVISTIDTPATFPR